MAAHLDTKAPAWELCKENAAPRKKGRDVAKLQRAFGGGAADDAEIARHEAALTQASDDPLRAYAAYASYLEQNRPTDALAAFELRERCCRTLRDDARYKDDARYVQTWLDYADQLEEPDDLFKFMKKKKIGLTSAAFWCAWALRSEERGHVKNAADLYEKGLAKGAAPPEMLAAKQRAFAARAVERAANPPPARPRPRGLTAQRPARAPPPPQQTSTAPGQVSSLAIFVDEGLQPVTVPVDDWPDFGSLSERAKENTRGPTPWTEAALPAPKSGAPTLASAAPPAFDVFVDEDCSAAEDLAEAPAAEAPTTIRD